MSKIVQFMFPFENPETLIVLPSPEFDNTDSLMSSITTKQALDGTLYVYKKTKEHQKLEWTFLLTPAKTEELKAGIDYYIGQYAKIVDHNDVVWRVLLSNDVFTFTSQTRDNWVEVQLELQGVKING